MPRRIRTFVALEMPAAVRARAADLQRQLNASGVSVKWVEEQNIHLTLKFLGEVNDVEVPAICAAVQQGAGAVRPFSAEVKGVGAFPNASRPRTLWVGVGQGGDAMVALQGYIETALAELGFRPEERRFTPHVTIGRVRDGAQTAELAEAVTAQSLWTGGTVDVREAVVMASELTPQGPQYSVMGRCKLKVR